VAIPIGTTARQTEALARWVLVSVVALAMLAWWGPGYRSWGALSAALLVVLAFWLLWRTVLGDRTVPGHPIHAVLLAPVVVLVFHVLRGAAGRGQTAEWALAGALNVSMICHFGLLSLGVMLSQSLLPKAARHVAVLAVCGAAMMLGPAAAMAWGQAEPVRTALALLGFGGVGVWLSALWGLDAPGVPPAHGFLPGRGWLRCLWVAVGALAAIAWMAAAPLQGLLMAGILAVTLFVAGLVFPRRRAGLLLTGGSLAVAVLGVLSLGRYVREALFVLVARTGEAGWLGRGEEAFRDVSASDAGLVVLAATVGFPAAGILLSGLAGCIVWLLAHARRGHAGDQGRAIVWTVAAGAVGAALLAPGGLFLPAATAAAVFVWGLLPSMLSRPARPRSGAYLLGGVVAVTILVGLARRAGLFSSALRVFGAGDALMHLTAGLLLGMLMAWLLGARRLWLGLVGLALAALAGGPGEVLQYALGTRTAEFRDWLYHCTGSAAAVVPYLLCVVARWCESPDVVSEQSLAAEKYLRYPAQSVDSWA